MTNYPFPRWRRIPFVAVLIVVLVISFGSSITQGTVNIRVYALIPPGIVNHVYVKFNFVQLHTAGFAPGSGIVTISQLIPKVDLVPIPGQFTPSLIASSSLTSGRFDSITIAVSNSTIVVDDGRAALVSSGPVLKANATITVPPNRRGDVLVVLSLDYSLLIATPPSISAEIHQITAVS